MRINPNNIKFDLIGSKRRCYLNAFMHTINNPKASILIVLCNFEDGKPFTHCLVKDERGIHDYLYNMNRKYEKVLILRCLKHQKKMNVVEEWYQAELLWEYSKFTVTKIGKFLKKHKLASGLFLRWHSITRMYRNYTYMTMLERGDK